MAQAARSSHKLTPVQWVICVIAAIGFAFDTYALLVLPLIVRPALMDLAKVKPGTPAFNYWVGLLFYIPAVAGGIFGLLGGYLTDRLGRRRILVWSILLYAFSALASGFATSPGMLLLLRCTTFIGVSVEFVAAVAWLAELFPDAKQRESVLGYTQAFSSVGGLLISAAYYIAVTYSKSLPGIYGGHEAWRYTLISGLIPAIPLILIRPFLPESPVWREKKAGRHSEAAQLRRVVPAGISQDHAADRADVRVQLWRGVRRDPAHSAHCSRPAAGGAPRPGGAGAGRQQGAVPAGNGRPAGPVHTGVSGDSHREPETPAAGVSDPGTVPGAVGVLLSRRSTIWACSRSESSWRDCSPWRNSASGAIICPGCTRRICAAQARALRQISAGRMIGTSAALLTTQLANVMPGLTSFTKLAYSAAAVALLVYAIGFLSSFWLPEPRADKLPE